jgi:hypothetical protein
MTLNQKILSRLLIAVAISGCVVVPQDRVSSCMICEWTVKLNPIEPVLVITSVILISTYHKIQKDGAGLLFGSGTERPNKELADYLWAKCFTA